MRAVTPVLDGVLDRDGFGVGYAAYSEGPATVCLVMPDTIVHARAWKAQVPFLSRFFRVVTVDPRGNGESDRPTRSEEFALQEVVDDVWGVLDHVGAETVVLVGLCSGAGLCLLLAAERPERVQGVVAINPGLPLTPPLPHKLERDFDAVSEADEWLWTHGSRPEGWAKLTRSYWLRDWAGFAEFFFGEMFPEPHSTKQVEDTVSWALETTPEVMLLDDEAEADPRFGVDGAEETCRRVRCPVLVLTGSLDMCQSPERGRLVAELTGGDLMVLEGCGHLPNARDPVKVNLLIRDFVRRVVGLDA